MFSVSRRSFWPLAASLFIHISFFASLLLGPVFFSWPARAPLGVTVDVVQSLQSAPRAVSIPAAKLARAFNPAATEKSAPAPAIAENSGVATASAAAIAPVGQADGVEASLKERYLHELRLYLEARKRYPALARSLRQEGMVKVSFELQNDGRIEDVRISQPSSHESLNRAAAQLLGAVEKFKPLPPGLTTIGRVIVPIEYRIGN